MPRLPRPVALTMPVVTVWPTPKGLPTASTMSPTCTLSLSAIGHDRQVLGVNLDHGDVGLGVAANDLGGELAAVLQGDFHVLGAVHDVVIGEDVAVFGDDDARAEAMLARRAELAVGHLLPNWSPKKCRQKGSLKPKPSGMVTLVALEVTTTLTTPGATFFTMGAKLV